MRNAFLGLEPVRGSTSSSKRWKHDPVGSAGARPLDKALAITATLTILGGSIHSGCAQNLAENPTSTPIAGFELPEGARQDPRDPERAFDPQTGQSLIRDSSGQIWINVKTGQAVGPARTVFFGPPKGARWDGSNPRRALNPQTGQKFVWDPGIQKWIDLRTDRVFNPVYIDQEGKPVRNLALSHASSGRGSPVIQPAAHVQVESAGNGSFGERFGYYFIGAAAALSTSLQFYTDRDAFRYSLAGQLASMTSFPERDDWIKSLLAPVDARLAPPRRDHPGRLLPLFPLICRSLMFTKAGGLLPTPNLCQAFSLAPRWV